MIRAQTILGSAIALLGVTAVVLVFRTPAEVAPARSFTSSQQCKECHAQEHAEWSASQHAHSWLNPDVRALSNDFANTDCIDCHAPQEIYSTGIGARVLPRASRRAEGPEPAFSPSQRASDGFLEERGSLRGLSRPAQDRLAMARDAVRGTRHWLCGVSHACACRWLGA